MKFLIPLGVCLYLGACTVVQVEGEGHQVYVESPTVSSDNGSTTNYEGGRRDPTVNIAPLTTW